MLAFTEYGPAAGPRYTVCIRKIDGSPPIRLGEGEAFEISPNGKWVLAGIASSPAQLVAYPTGPGSVRRLDLGNFDGFERSWWTPDGDSIVFLGNERGKSVRFYTQSFAG